MTYYNVLLTLVQSAAGIDLYLNFQTEFTSEHGLRIARAVI